jgi:hypothetical protein
MGVIVKAVFEAVIQKAGDVIPADVLTDLSQGVKDLANLDKLAEIADIQALGELAGKAGEEAGKAAKELGEIGDKAKQGLGGLIGGDKDKKKDE